MPKADDGLRRAWKALGVKQGELPVVLLLRNGEKLSRKLRPARLPVCVPGL